MPGTRFAQALPQSLDPHINGACVSRIARFPECIDQLLTRKNPVGILGQKTQHAKFVRAERDRTSLPARLLAADIDAQRDTPLKNVSVQVAVPSDIAQSAIVSDSRGDLKTRAYCTL